MSVGVVDQLEAIEVEEQQRQSAVCTRGPIDRMQQPVLKQHAVWQLRGGIEVRQPMDALGREFLGRDVSEHTEIVLQPPGPVMHRDDGAVFGIHLTVTPPAPQLANPDTVGIQRGQDLLVQAGFVTPRAQHRIPPPHHLRFAPTGNPGERRVDHADSPLGVSDHDPLRAVLKHAGRKQQLPYRRLSARHVFRAVTVPWLFVLIGNQCAAPSRDCQTILVHGRGSKLEPIRGLDAK